MSSREREDWEERKERRRLRLESASPNSNCYPNYVCSNCNSLSLKDRARQPQQALPLHPSLTSPRRILPLSFETINVLCIKIEVACEQALYMSAGHEKIKARAAREASRGRIGAGGDLATMPTKSLFRTLRFLYDTDFYR